MKADHGWEEVGYRTARKHSGPPAGFRALDGFVVNVPSNSPARAHALFRHRQHDTPAEERDLAGAGGDHDRDALRGHAHRGGGGMPD